MYLCLAFHNTRLYSALPNPKLILPIPWASLREARFLCFLVNLHVVVAYYCRFVGATGRFYDRRVLSIGVLTFVVAFVDTVHKSN